MVWHYNPNNIADPASIANPPSYVSFQPFNKDYRPDTSAPYITAGGQGLPFRRPASAHPGVFNVVFVGGNTRAISETIDYRVYQQLMTPHGVNAVDPVTGDGEQTMEFMTNQLSDSDY